MNSADGRSPIKMAIPILRIYSTTMWKKYTTPISREIATYSVGISEMAMPVYVIILCITQIILGADRVWIYSSMIPIVVYILVLLFVFRIVGRLDMVLNYESSENDGMAEECAQTIRKIINGTTLVTAAVTAIWVLAGISFST